MGGWMDGGWMEDGWRAAGGRGGSVMTAKELFCWALSGKSLVCCVRAGSALSQVGLLILH